MFYTLLSLSTSNCGIMVVYLLYHATKLPVSEYRLCYQALHVAGQVAGASVSTSPLPYGTMTSQCEALGLGTRKKLSSWLVNGHESTPDNPMPSLPTAHHSIIPKVRRWHI